jgi:hypothetical protein
MRLIEKQEELGGIDVSKLKTGTKLIVETINSKYDITILDGRKVLVQGGKYFKNPTESVLIGSTFGGSMIKVGWIGYDMYMEIGTIRTSSVKTATIVGDDWQYEMKWDTEE